MIRALPVDVQQYLRSGVAITSATQCVEELVLNAIDAGATCVAVRLNLYCFKIQVVDNGSGVEFDQLHLLGNRYATSKCHTVSDLTNLCYFGYRGEALASITNTCGVLEITTRTKQSTNTHCKLFKNGKELKVGESSIPRPSPGTTITVHDLFHNFPVRKQSMNISLEFERVRQRLEGLALLQPGVSISLRNDATGNVVLQTRRCSSTVTTFTHLFGTSKAKTLREVHSSKGHFIVDGYIGTEGYMKKDLQFVYINGRLVLKTMLHKTLNQSLQKSSICNKKYGQSSTSPDLNAKMSVFSSPVKFVDKYPVYILNVKCPLTEYDITFDPAKTLVQFKDWDVVLECTADLVSTFLKKENLNTWNAGSVAEVSDSYAVPSAGHQDQKKQLTISPSNFKDTIVSKRAKRNVRVQQPDFLTPETVTLEEWTAENQSNKLCGKVSSDRDTSEISYLSSTDSSDISGRDISRVQSAQSSGTDDSDVSRAKQHSDDAEELRSKRNSNTADITELPVSDQPLSSLLEYRKLIGKHKITRTNSVEESLKKIAKLMTKQSDSGVSEARSAIQTSREQVNVKGLSQVHSKPLQGHIEASPEVLPPYSTQEKMETSVFKEQNEGKRHYEKMWSKLKNRLKNVHQHENDLQSGEKSEELSITAAKPGNKKYQRVDTTAAKLSRLVKQNSAVITIDPEPGTPHLNSAVITIDPEPGTPHLNSAVITIDPEPGTPHLTERLDTLHRDFAQLPEQSTSKQVGKESFQSKWHPFDQKDDVNAKSTASTSSSKLSQYSSGLCSTVNFPPDYTQQTQIPYSVNVTNKVEEKVTPEKATTNKKNVLLVPSSNWNNTSSVHMQKDVQKDCSQRSPPHDNTSSVHLQKDVQQDCSQRSPPHDNTNSVHMQKDVQQDCSQRSPPHDNTNSVHMQKDVQQDCSQRSPPHDNTNSVHMQKDVQQDCPQRSLPHDSPETFVAVPLHLELDQNKVGNLHCENNDFNDVYHAEETESHHMYDMTGQVVTDNTEIGFSTQAFSPSIAQSQSGLSDLMKETSLSQGFIPQFHSTDMSQELTTGNNTPVSEGFSPHLDHVSIEFSPRSPSHLSHGHQDDGSGSADNTRDKVKDYYNGLACAKSDALHYTAVRNVSNIELISESDTECKIECTEDKHGKAAKVIDECKNDTDLESKIPIGLTENIDVVENGPNQSIQLVKPSSEIIAKVDGNSSHESRNELYHRSGHDSYSRKFRNQSVMDSLELSSPSLSQMFRSQTVSPSSRSAREPISPYSNKMTFSYIFTPSQAESKHQDKYYKEQYETEEEQSGARNQTAGFETKAWTSISDEMNWSSCSYMEQIQSGTSLAEEWGSYKGNNAVGTSLAEEWGSYKGNNAVKTTVSSFRNNAEHSNESDNNKVNITNKGHSQAGVAVGNMDDTMNIDLENVDCTASEAPGMFDDNYSTCYKNGSVHVSSRVESDGIRINTGMMTITGGAPSPLTVSSAPSTVVSDEYRGSDQTNSKGGSKMAVSADTAVTMTGDGGSPDAEWKQVQDPATGETIYVHSLLGMTVPSAQWKGPDCSKQGTKQGATERKDRLKSHPLLREHHMREFRLVPGSTRSSVPGTSTRTFCSVTPGTRSSVEPGTSTVARMVPGSVGQNMPGTSSDTIASSIVTSEGPGSDIQALISEHFNDEEEMQVKWREKHTVEQGSSSVDSLFAAWNTSVPQSAQKDIVSAEMSELPFQNVIKTLQSLHSCTFTKAMLADVQVVGQLDNKFIVCLMKTDSSSGGKSVVVIDQHAAHERVRLEMLTEEAYVNGNPECGRLAHFKVDPSRMIILTRDEVRVMMSYEEEFARIGIKFSTDTTSGSSVRVHSVPACLVKHEVTEGRKQKEIIYWKTIETLMKDHVQLLVSTHGMKGRFPPVIHRVLCSLACHGATKFGDPLSRLECEALVRDLSGCSLPFQCAHGRPSVMPILQLDQHHRDTALGKQGDVLWKRSKPRLHKLISSMQSETM